MNQNLAKSRSAQSFNLKPITFALLGALAFQAQAEDAFVDLNPLVGDTFSFAYAVSADGNVVVGNSADGGFRWTSTGDVVLFKYYCCAPYRANAVSADGNVVVGESGNDAFLWTLRDGPNSLGFLYTPSYEDTVSSSAYGVSADGNTVVGSSSSSGIKTYITQAFRWKDGVMEGLGFLDEYSATSSALGVSADGNVVVGYSINSDGNEEAFRWEGDVMTGLGFLGTGTSSVANAVSADGNVVVGFSGELFGDSEGYFEAFRWEDDVMTGLGHLFPEGTYSFALGVSADGNVVVGYSENSVGNEEAFRWTQGGGMQSIAAWLAAAGVAAPEEFATEDSRATAVSANGDVVVGDLDGKAFLARVDSAGSGLLTDIGAFNKSLIEAGARGAQAGAALPNLTLFGAHHRSILDNGLVRTGNDGACAWATTDAARNNKIDSRMEIAEVGVCKDISSARIGLGIGQAWLRQDLSLGGNTRFDGQYLIAEAANAFSNGLEASVTGYYGRFDTDISRHYMNGGSVDSSKASPDSRVYASRARVDWKDAVTLGRFSLSPYAAYTWVQTKLDSYTETGGGFPAQFAAATWRTQDIRVGAAAKTALATHTDLRLGLEAAHRIDNNTDGVKVQVVGLGMLNQSLPGQNVNQSWVRTTVDVDHRFTDDMALTVGANVASSGGDATWGVTAGLRANF